MRAWRITKVHERAWVTVIDWEVEITTAAGESVAGARGLMVEFAPGERHAVRALTTARLLLLLTPWPGDGHPGTMPLSDKATVRQRAADHRASERPTSLGQARQTCSVVAARCSCG